MYITVFVKMKFEILTTNLNKNIVDILPKLKKIKIAHFVTQVEIYILE